MFRIIGDTNINFIGLRKIACLVSLVLIALGIFALVMIATGKANMGIDFSGGVMLTGHFEKPVTIEQLRAALASQYPEAAITRLTDYQEENAFIIKTKGPETEEEARQMLAGIKSTIEQAIPDNSFSTATGQEMLIGPAVGETLRSDAQKAILLSLLGIILYIWIRFDFRSGIAAAVATFHDVLAVMGIFYILNLEFDLLTVTALLTLAGYSLTDTVVVFDRIRENLKKFRSKGEFTSCVNSSINEMLSRTINTSLTTIVVVFTLLLFGGEVLRNFSLALVLGIIVGTYSSVFVASPIVVEWEARSPKRFK